jgi:hypothetical protein
VAAKLGFFKGLWVLILGAKNFIIIGVAAVAAWFRKLFGGKARPRDGLLIVVKCHNAVTDRSYNGCTNHRDWQRAFFVIPSAVEKSLTILLCCRDPSARPRSATAATDTLM